MTRSRTLILTSVPLMAVVAIACLVVFDQTEDATWQVGAYVPLGLIAAIGLLLGFRPDLMGSMTMDEPEPSSADLLRVISDSAPHHQGSAAVLPNGAPPAEFNRVEVDKERTTALDPFSIVEPPEAVATEHLVTVSPEQQEAANVKIAEIFVNLGRRNKQLNRQMLTLISHLERDELDPELLEGLYELDHLATRMRRNQETLLNLSSARKVRQWSQPVKVENVLRSALAEVERFARVEIDEVPDVELLGAVVADATHLLAELLDNATTFSHTSTTVALSAHTTLEGLEIEVMDSGHGIEETKITELNHLLENPPALWDAPSRRLGLFIAALLAKDHEIGVSLSGERGVGTVATISIPHALLVEEEEEVPSLDAIGLVDPVLQVLVGSELAEDDEAALAAAALPTNEEVEEALPSFPSVTLGDDISIDDLPALDEMPPAATFPAIASTLEDTFEPEMFEPEMFEPEMFEPAAFHPQVFEPAEFESSTSEPGSDESGGGVAPLPSRIPQATFDSVWKDAPLDPMPTADVTPLAPAELSDDGDSFDDEVAQSVARRAADSISAFANGVSEGLQSTAELDQRGPHSPDEGDEQ